VLIDTTEGLGGTPGADVTDVLPVPFANYDRVGAVYGETCGINREVNVAFSPVDFSYTWSRAQDSGETVLSASFEGGFVDRATLTYGVEPFGFCQVDLYLHRS
jgi:hypothetical protein